MSIAHGTLLTCPNSCMLTFRRRVSMKRAIVLLAVFLVVFAAILPSPASADNWHRGHRAHVGWWWPGALVGGLVFGAVALATAPIWALGAVRGKCGAAARAVCASAGLRRSTGLLRGAARVFGARVLRAAHVLRAACVFGAARVFRAGAVHASVGKLPALHESRAGVCRPARGRVPDGPVRAPWRRSAPAMAVGLGVGALGATGGRRRRPSRRRSRARASTGPRRPRRDRSSA